MKLKLPNDIEKLESKTIDEIAKYSRAISIRIENGDENVYSDIFGRWVNIFYDPTDQYIHLKLRNPRYVKRRLLNLIASEVLYSEQKKGMIGGKSGSTYVGVKSLENRQKRDEYNLKYLESRAVLSASGYKSLASLSQSQYQKFSELYVVCLGIEQRAKKLDYDAIFLTLTVPAVMHPNPISGKNCWDGTSAKEAHSYLKSRWDAFKKDLSRPKHNVKFSDGDAIGFRVVEPHADGTPHWHILLYASNENINNTIIKLAEIHFQHSEHALKIEKIKRQNTESNKAGGIASPTSYMTKYILKNIEYQTKNSIDSDGLDKSSVDAVCAWRKAVSIRAFQTFGIEAAITTWRNLRKLQNEIKRLEVYLENQDRKLDQSPKSDDFSNGLSELHLECLGLENGDLEDLYSQDLKMLHVEKVDNSPIPKEISLSLLSSTQTKNYVKNRAVFSEFLDILEVFKSYGVSVLIREKYKTEYGEYKSRIVGVDLGFERYYFCKKEIFNISHNLKRNK